MSKKNTKTTHAFQTEVKQLLQLMIHSLYSNRNIFLRELISNASDACDKLRFESIDNPKLLENDPDFNITIDYDQDQKIITVTDNGIGMTYDDMITHLGTIAKSGTKEFFSKLTGDQKKDAKLIGQFGVGFYSSFIVANQVTVLTRHASAKADDAVLWQSDGSGSYEIEKTKSDARGTKITLHLKEDHLDLLASWKLKQLIHQYSDHIVQPILMKKETLDSEKKETIKTEELETVNRASALWARSKKDIKDEEYIEFYKHISHDFNDPLAWTHSRVEGKTEYTQLLYIPENEPFDLWDRQSHHGIKLYIQRVFIIDDAEKILPKYLRFVRGIVDANDLPLNVSREILQQSKTIETIHAGCTKKILSLLGDLAKKDAEKYQKFWSKFGAVLKEGVTEDFANKDTLAKLFRFATTHEAKEEQTVSLEDYIGRMKSDQQSVYYVAAESYNAAKNSPHLEIFSEKGIEVLLLSERIDEWLVNHLTEFEGKKLVSVAKGNLDLDRKNDEEQDKEASQETDPDNQDLIEKMKKSLAETVKEVRSTSRLVSSPACLVSDENEASANLLRIMKSAGQSIPDQKPILEINLKHPLIMRLKSEEAQFDDWAKLIFEQALLAEGGHLDDPGSFVRRMNNLIHTLSATSS